MYCPKCREFSTKVKDCAQSHKPYVIGRGREYLEKWGNLQLEVLRVKPSSPFVARALQCKLCKTKYRSLEVLLEVTKGYKTKQRRR